MPDLPQEQLIQLLACQLNWPSQHETYHLWSATVRVLVKLGEATDELHGCMLTTDQAITCAQREVH